jgi:hypothetical protein
MSRLTKLRIRDAETATDASSGIDVFHVRDPHALVQAAGYLKFVLADEGKHVFYRGQSRLHQGLIPSLFRGHHSRQAQDKRICALKSAIEGARKRIKALGNLPEQVMEPLLQHYGLRTSWVDLVDNVWVALWFACYRAHAAGENGKFLHFEKRAPRTESTLERFAYIVLVAVDTMQGSTATPGLWRGDQTEFIDLRVAAPSIFLRPHAQHGVLFRLKGDAVRRPNDYHPAVVGAIRVGLDDALEWLGEGTLLNIHALFPPPLYDHGYRFLLQDWSSTHIPESSLIGVIHHVGA